MSSPQTTSPQQACEAILIEGKRYNIEHGILPSENAVADRLLARGVELREAYGVLYEKLLPRPPALKVFLDLLLSTAAFWSPEKIAEARVAAIPAVAEQCPSLVLKLAVGGPIAGSGCLSASARRSSR